jgi:hypothetical protein
LVYRRNCNYDPNAERVIISIFGGFNKGKSHFVNALCQLNIAEGCEIHTLGPSFVTSKLRGDNLAYCDTAGIDVAVKKNEERSKKESERTIPDLKIRQENFQKKLIEKTISDEIQKDFIIQSSNILIIVVGVLSITEQKMINLINKQYQGKKKFVIHNFYQLTNFDEILEKIKTDILLSFNVIPQRFDKYDGILNEKIFPWYFLEDKTSTYHLVIGNSYSKEPNYKEIFNDQTLKFIKRQANDSKKFNFLGKFRKIFEESIFQITKARVQLQEFSNKKLGNIETRILKVVDPPRKDFFYNVAFHPDGQINFRRNDTKDCEYLSFVYPIGTSQEEEQSTLYVDVCLTSKALKNCKFEKVDLTHKKMFLKFTTMKIKIDLKTIRYEISPSKVTTTSCTAKPISTNILRVTVPILYKIKSAQSGLSLKITKEDKILMKNFFPSNFEINQNIVGEFESNDLNERLEKEEKQILEPDLKKSHTSKGEQNYYQLRFEIQEIRDGDNESLKEITIFSKVLQAFQEYLKEKNLKIVAFTGLFNKGKTFLLSQLCGKECLNEIGFGKKTQGLCLKFDKGVLYIDSEGFERAILKESLNEKEKNILESDFDLRLKTIKEKIYQQFLIENSQILIIVLSQVTYSDQKLLEKIVKTCNDKEKKVIIIHNFLDISDNATMEKKIEELKEIFNFNEGIQKYNREAQGDESNFTNQQFFQEDFMFDKNHKISIQHLIFAKDTSPAGHYYNRSAIKHLRTLIYDLTIPKIFSVEESFLNFAKETLREHYRTTDNNSIQVSDFGNFSSENGFFIKKASTIQGCNIVPNKFIINFMGELESFNKWIPNIEIKTTQEDKDKTIYNDKIIMHLPADENNYEVEICNKHHIGVRKNENLDIEFYFSIMKKKYEPKEIPDQKYFLIDDKTSMGSINIKTVVKKAKEGDIDCVFICENTDKGHERTWKDSTLTIEYNYFRKKSVANE